MIPAKRLLFRPIDLGELTPAEVASQLRHLPGMVFFDTALESGSRGEISLISAEPVEQLRGNLRRDLETLQNGIARWDPVATVDHGFPHGFAAGWIEYDGDFVFGIYPELLIFDHHANRWYEVGELSNKLRPASGGPAPIPRHGPMFQAKIDAERFCTMVRRAQEYIADGHIYQVNLAHPFHAQWEGDSFTFYQRLRHYSPAPHAAYLKLAGRVVASSSPESFLKMSGQAIRTRPIKGTRPRRADASADQRSAADLLTSSKEIAELVMITDLERNDLGMVCEWGSVNVRELLALERYEQVFHLVSTVEGRLRREVDHTLAVQACFPGGSITGAPKKRAREIIAELEPYPRGLYTGALGWFGFGGESQFSIAIRTVVMEQGVATFHVGAGIVADSVPEKEWQETLDKAAGILLASERYAAAGI